MDSESSFPFLFKLNGFRSVVDKMGSKSSHNLQAL